MNNHGKSERMIIEKEKREEKLGKTQNELDRLNQYRDKAGIPLTMSTSEISELIGRTLQGKEGSGAKNIIQKINRNRKAAPVGKPVQKKM